MKWRVTPLVLLAAGILGCPAERDREIRPALRVGNLAEGDGRVSISGSTIVRFPGEIVEVFEANVPESLTQLESSDVGPDCVLGRCGGVVVEGSYAFAATLAGIRRAPFPGGETDWALDFDFREGRIERVPGGLAVLAGDPDEYYVPIHLISTSGGTPAVANVVTESFSDFSVDGSKIFAVSSNGDLAVIDAASFAAPTITARIPLTLEDGAVPTWELGARAVAIEGTRILLVTAGPPAFTLEGLGSCRLDSFDLDVENESATVVDRFEFDAPNCMALEVEGGYAFLVADGDLQVLSVGGDSIERIRRVRVSGTATDVELNPASGVVAVSSRDEIFIYNLSKLTVGEEHWP